MFSKNRDQLREILMSLQPGDYIIVSTSLSFQQSAKASRSLGAMVNHVNDKRRADGVMIIRDGSRIAAVHNKAVKQFSYVI